MSEPSGSGGAENWTNVSPCAEVRAGRTPVFVSVDGKVVGVMEMEDQVRVDASETISRLRQRNMRTVLLSGDRQETAESVGIALGMDLRDIYGREVNGNKHSSDVEYPPPPPTYLLYSPPPPPPPPPPPSLHSSSSSSSFSTSPPPRGYMST